MLYSLKYNTVFFHIPKTAGTSIIEALDLEIVELVNLNGYEYDRYHVTPAQALRYNPIENLSIENAFKFSFVRNPWDRLVSGYFNIWHKRFKSFDEFLMVVENVVKREENGEEIVLNEYVPDWHKEKPGIEAHWRPQYHFTQFNGNTYVDFIGRFENLQEDIAVVFSKLNVNKTLNKKNSSEHKHYRKYYNRKTKKLVSEIYKKDIEIFDYKY